MYYSKYMVSFIIPVHPKAIVSWFWHFLYCNSCEGFQHNELYFPWEWEDWSAKTLPARFTPACLQPLNSILPYFKFSSCCNRSPAAIWGLLTRPEHPRGFQLPHICRSSHNLPGHVGKSPSHSAASTQSSAWRGSYRRPSVSRWSATRDNLQEETTEGEWTNAPRLREDRTCRASVNFEVESRAI